MSAKVYTMEEQLKQENIQTHLGILKKYFGEMDETTNVLNLRDVHHGHYSNRDIEVEAMIGNDSKVLIVEGKRDSYKKEDTHDEEHMAIEIFAYCTDGVFPFRDRYEAGRRIDVDSSVYLVLHNHINKVIDGIEDGTHTSGVKYGYGWTKELTQKEYEIPIFSYFWRGWKKAGLYEGDKLRDLAMKLFEDKDKNCKFVITLNDDYVTVNFLIPSHMLRENGCLISLVDFDEETELPKENV